MSSLVKIANKINSSLRVLAKKTPKSSLKVTLSTGVKTFENLKPENYRSDIIETSPYTPP